MSNSLDSFLTRIGDVTIERVTPRGSPRSTDQGGGSDDPPMRSSVSNPCMQTANDGDGESDDIGGDSDGEHNKKRGSMEIEEVEEIHSEGSGDDMDLDDTIDTEIGVRMDSERHDLESPCPDDDVDAVNILDTLPLEGAPIEGQEVTEADLLGKPLMKDDDSESLDNDNIQSETQSGDEDDGSKRRGDSDDSDPAKKKQKKDDSDDPECELKSEKKIANMRRNIREVMDETQLDEATLAAQRQEMERLRRVQEQQRIIREVQRQIAINRHNSKTQTRVISLLQGKQNDIDASITESSSCSSSQVKLPSTVMLKVNSGTGTGSGSQTPSGTQPGQSPRRSIEGMRWQKGRGGCQGTQTSISRVPNARTPTTAAGQTNTLQQRIRMMTPSVSISPVIPKNEPLDKSEYYSDSDMSDAEADDVIYEKQMRKAASSTKSPKPAKGKDVVTISSSSDSSDDDCIVLSDPSGEEETDNDDDPANSGMHTNDRYNIPDEHGRVLVNVGHPETEPDVYLAPQVARVIKPHQIGGIRFLYDNIVESIERFKTSSGFGCILAHSMGLGKTLQVASFCDIFFRCTTAKTVLCIMPINTLQNWLAEFNMWLPYEDPNAIKFDTGLTQQKSEIGHIDTKHEIKEDSSNHTDMSSMSSRPISTESAHRSIHDNIQHIPNMMTDNIPYGHTGYDNHNAMPNYYSENLINKPGGIDQHAHNIRQEYHNAIPQNSIYNTNMGSMNNYKLLKQENEGNDMNIKPPGSIPNYGTEVQSAVGMHGQMDIRTQGQVYSTTDSRNSVYPMINNQGQMGGYGGYQNMVPNNVYGDNTTQMPIHHEQEVKKEHLHDSNIDVNIKKEPNEAATKDEGTSTNKEESTDEKKPVEKASTPFSVDASIGMVTRHRHFRLHILNDSHKTMAARARVINEWQKVGGVLLIGYELYRQLSLKKPNKAKRKRGQPFKDTVDVEEDDKNKGLLEDMHGALVNPGPDLVICDEGHRIKNSHASISLALKQMRTKRRIVLTGYPLQNNLLEYWCMVDFVRPNYLGTKSEFCNMFERPIQNGQCIDSTPQDIRLMRYRAHVLHALLEGFVQRRSHSVLQVSLPRKEEYILLVRMTAHQRKLYDVFMNQVVKTRAVPNPLKAFAVCCKIWNHPDILFHFLRKRQANEEDDLDLEETMGEKSTPGGKRAKARATKGDTKKGKKLGATIKSKPAASVPPNSSSSTSNDVVDGENSHSENKGNYSNYPPSQTMQNPSYTNTGQQNSYPQGYQNYRPNDQTNYYRNDQQTGEYNNYYNNNLEQQRYPSQQSSSSSSSSFPSYSQNDLSYSTSQSYSQNQQQSNYTQGNEQNANNPQKYPSHPVNSNFRGDQSNSGSYDIEGMYPRQQYGFQEQSRNYPSNDTTNVNQTQYPQNNNNQSVNYQNSIPNQSTNVSMTDFSSYGQQNQNQNYSSAAGTNNQQQQMYTRNDNQSLGYTSTQQNQSVPAQSHQPPSSTGYMGNQTAHQNQQNTSTLISANTSHNYPAVRQNQPTGPMHNTPQTNNMSQMTSNIPTQNQSMYTSNQSTQNPVVQNQPHGYMSNQQSSQSTMPQNQMRSYQQSQQNQYTTGQNQVNSFSSAQQPGSLPPGQGHGYLADQNSAQKHGYSSSRLGSSGAPQNSAYPMSQSCQASSSGNQTHNYPANQQLPLSSSVSQNQQHRYNQNSSQNQGPMPQNQPTNFPTVQHGTASHGQPEQSNMTGNYSLNQQQQNQYSKVQDEQYPWQGNYSQSSRQDQCNDQYFRDSSNNRYQQNSYYPQQNYVQQQNPSYDYSAGHAGNDMNTKAHDGKAPQPGMVGHNQAAGNYDKSTKESGTNISGVQNQSQLQSNVVPGTNYTANDNNIGKSIQKVASCHGMNNRPNPTDINKDEDKDKDEVQLEKDKDEKSDDENLTKDEEKDLKNYSSGKEDPGIPYDWAIDLMKGYVPGLIDASAKMTLFFCILEEAIRLGDRVLAFSQSLFTLNLIEDFLARNNIKYPEGQTDAWIKNVNYYRLDGSTSALEREKLINEFNHNPKIHLFLVSTRAGSLGINLVGANRAIVFDASWNPCHDTQAVCRVYRYGQQKPCYVYRLVTDNCLERKIYDRQISKQGMADRVVDQCNPDAHLSLKEATTLSWDWEEDSQVQDFSDAKDNYSDEIMHLVLDRHSSLLTKQPFHHESLLVDRKDKKLSQAEKRLARRGYELEKMAANCSKPSYNYIPGNTATRAGGLQIRAIRGGDTGVTPKPVASVRPMQQRGAESGIGGTRGIVGSRWIPAEVWQRQGMSAQEMTLPLDVVIPTNSPDKSSIVLKAGQRVMVLKSPKGIYMQLESGKIIAIRTALKINQQKREEEPKKATTTVAQRNVKPDVSFPLRNNSAISIIPKTPATPPTPAPRMVPRPGSGTGFKQQIDKDITKRPRNMQTPMPRPNTSQLNITNQVSLQRLPKSKHDSMDHSSVGENSNSSDSQPRTDQRVEEVRLEDVVAEASSNPDYSPTNQNRIISTDIEPALQRVCETKTQNYGSNSISIGQVNQTVQSSVRIDETDMALKDDKEHNKPPELNDPERSTQTINYGHKYPNQPVNNDRHSNENLVMEESIATAPPVQPSLPLPPQMKQPQHLPQDMHTNQQLLPHQSPYAQRPPEMTKPMPDTNIHRPVVPMSTGAHRTPVKDRAPDGQEISPPATAGAAPTAIPDSHGLSQAYPYAQYPRYYDYGDPRSQNLATPYGSYYPGSTSHSGNPRLTETNKSQPNDRVAKLPEERITVPMSTTYSQPTSAVTSMPTVEPIEVKAPVESTPPVTSTTSTTNRIDPHISTAFSHPANSRYSGTYPPTPYDPYPQHYTAAPSSSAAYPPSGAPGYGAYGGPTYNADYARMYSAFHGPPPSADPYMHRGYPPPTTHPSNYYSPFPHPPPPPYPNYSFLPPYPNPNMPNESQPPTQ